MKDLSVADRLAIHELLGLYGHLIDERQFDRLPEIFTADAVFDLSGFDGTRYEGLPAIMQMMRESRQHPLAHHATNVVVFPYGAAGARSGAAGAAETAEALSKGIGVGYKGRVGSVVYRDQLMKTKDGWRIRERHCELRDPARLPGSDQSD